MRRIPILFASVILAAFLLSLGCSDSRKTAQEDEPPPPPSVNDKIVFSQVYSSSDETSAKMLMPPPPARQFFATPLVQGESKQITPGLTGINGLGLAPNGDFWFFADYGLFISNVNSPEVRPIPIAAAQQLATGYITTDPAKSYKIAAGGSKAVRFIHMQGDPDNYYTLLKYDISVYSGNQYIETINMILVYNSKDNKLKKLFPFTVTEEDDISIDLPYSFWFPDFSDELLYSLGLFIGNNDKETEYVIRYDPSNDTYQIRLAIPSYVGWSIIRAQNFFDNLVYADTGDISDIDTDKCKEGIGKQSEDAAKKAVADCLNKALEGKKIAFYRFIPMKEDITVKSKEDLLKILDKELENKKSILSINAGLVRKFGKGSSSIDCNNTECHVRSKIDVITAVTGDFEIFAGKENIYFVSSNPDDSETLNKVNISSGVAETLETTAAKGHFDLYSFSEGSDNTGGLLLYANFPPSAQSKPPLKLYSEKLSGSLEIVSSDKGYSLAEFTEHSGNKYFFRSGFTNDGRRIIYYPYGKGDAELAGDGNANSISDAYYIDVEALLSGEGVKVSDVTMPAAPNISKPYIRILWKDHAIWSSEGTLYINTPFEKDNTPKKIAAHASLEGIATVSEFKPSADLGLSLSENFGEIFACGGKSKFALYCAGEYEMCEDGTCVPKADVCAKHTDCKKAYTVCVTGFCNTKSCDGDAECPVGSQCETTKKSCTYAGVKEDECFDDGQCAKLIGGDAILVLECLMDTVKGYKTCRAETPECVSDDDCKPALGCPTCADIDPEYASQEFGCTSAEICVPKMGAITVAYPTPIIKPAAVDFKVNLSWKKVKNFKGETIDDYRIGYHVIPKDPQTITVITFVDATGNSRTINLSIPGNEEEKDVAVFVETNPPESGYPSETKTIKLENTTHCMLADENAKLCPSVPSIPGFPSLFDYSYTCEKDPNTKSGKCVKQYQHIFLFSQ